MRLRPILIVSKTLLVSQLRSTRMGYKKGSFTRRPIILLIVAVLAFAIPAAIAYEILQLLRSATFFGPILSVLSQSTPQYIAALPAFVTSGLILLGLILELSQSSQFSSTDTVNWLPLTAWEYVTASNFAMVSLYSFLPMLAAGALLPFALAFGQLPEWILAVLLSFFGAFLASSLLEIIRGVQNRLSSSFYKRGGRRVIVTRLLVGIFAIVLLQIAFNPNFLQIFVGPITTAFAKDWFIPLFWSSVSIFQLSSGGSFASIAFGAGFFGLTFLSFYVATVIREKYWVPIPVAIRVSNREYSPAVGFWKYLGLSSPQMAIAKKDLRSMVRRRETQRLLAVPVVIFIAFLLPTLRPGPSSQAGVSISLFLGFFSSLFPTVFSALIFSASSVGQEGKGILNLYYNPVDARDFVVGKAVPSMLYSLILATGVSVLASFLYHFSVFEASMLFILCVGVATQASIAGMFFGVSFPDFSEGPRSRFVTASGSLLATIVVLITSGICAAPSIVALVILGASAGIELILLAWVSFAIAVGIAFFFYKLSLSRADLLLREYHL